MPATHTDELARSPINNMRSRARACEGLEYDVSSEAQSKQVPQQHCWLRARNSYHKTDPNALETRSAVRTLWLSYPEFSLSVKY